METAIVYWGLCRDMGFVGFMVFRDQGKGLYGFWGFWIRARVCGAFGVQGSGFIGFIGLRVCRA